VREFMVLLYCLAMSACGTPTQPIATAAGIATGAVVGGPVGAVVGGIVGAVATAPGAPLSPGYCYVHDRYGRIFYYRNGRPRIIRC
jgi:hypothetical protein